MNNQVRNSGSDEPLVIYWPLARHDVVFLKYITTSDFVLFLNMYAILLGYLNILTGNKLNMN